MSHSIAICADYGYLKPAETLIKSIAYHNHNVTINLLNTNIPQEWFTNVNRQLAPINVKVNDTKFMADRLANEAVSRDYMNPMIYGRILIPQLIPDDRVVYLDADTIVNGSLKELFTLDMEGHTIGAVEDYTMAGTFNSGMLLIDNQKLREDKSFTDDLLTKGQEPTSNDDQTLLNEHFKDQWLHLPNKYNFQIGLDGAVFYTEHDNINHYNKMLKAAKPRLIIHYSTSDKPWKMTSSSRLRDKWWQYNGLDYNDIRHHSILPVMHRKPKASLFTFTASQDFNHLEELLKAFPAYDFNVLAWTNMGNNLLTLSKYHNLHLYPSVIGANIDKLINQATAYLDINYGDKEVQFIDRIIKLGKPIFTYEDTQTIDNHDQQTVLPKDDVDGMIQQLKHLTQN